jgi:hypothetical protein
MNDGHQGFSKALVSVMLRSAEASRLTQPRCFGGPQHDTVKDF